MSSIFRYLAVHIPYISFVRKTLGILNQGPNPPPVLRLSDGGHVENLGILPLLKLRLKKIISVFGGQAYSEQEFSETLLTALEMARKKLRCSFTGLDGRDISEDIRVNLVERTPGNQPRSYRFVICNLKQGVFATFGQLKVEPFVGRSILIEYFDVACCTFQ